jgi:hypothetical protein
MDIISLVERFSSPWLPIKVLNPCKKDKNKETSRYKDNVYLKLPPCMKSPAAVSLNPLSINTGLCLLNLRLGVESRIVTLSLSPCRK